MKLSEALKNKLATLQGMLEAEKACDHKEEIDQLVEDYRTKLELEMEAKKSVEIEKIGYKITAIEELIDEAKTSEGTDDEIID